ncbi:hypothetical protein GCM10007920_01530 [Ciceribacter naphthalenivorans]|uniref:DUF2336 domain-containing protein n=2 Tax=Alphaproteobacteria TaxID=28211 RepID=A0A512HCR8_9HYPH|nr:hypothetical protein RNA01_01680 [Ciceribacter naphthalenivorans]GLR20369.1 hypothetical protein GCM10007920_01530 [Ciceribacter naphthalenivorans]GLT03225.1 hypothetical protein GCM10007926_01530 [Sphingomonas psychrolutea]
METAKAGDRARAANALARAYLRSAMAPAERQAAHVAMTYLLDDPSPRVRLALAEALAPSAGSPRALMISLAEDQPAIASLAILQSPVLSDSDLVDLAGRGNGLTRALIAARPNLSRGVAAALAEIGDAEEVAVLLENGSASIARVTLRRIAERHGANDSVRAHLLDRADLPAAVRQLLVQCVAAALSGSAFVQAAVGSARIGRITREAGCAATIAILGSVSIDELPLLVEQLRAEGRLTPAFLMHALCVGRTDFFAAVLTALSGLEERRVRAILATARYHAVRALLESIGLTRDISPVFVEAIMLWRRAVQSADHSVDSIAPLLIHRLDSLGSLSTVAADLMDMVAKLAIAEERRRARDYANDLALAA